MDGWALRAEPAGCHRRYHRDAHDPHRLPDPFARTGARAGRGSQGAGRRGAPTGNKPRRAPATDLPALQCPDAASARGLPRLQQLRVFQVQLTPDGGEMAGAHRLSASSGRAELDRNVTELDPTIP